MRDMTQSQVMAEQDRADEMISAAVRGLIAQRRLTPPQVAVAVGVSRSAFFNKLNGSATWKAHEVSRLAAFFRVSLDSLYEGRAMFNPRATDNLDNRGTRSSTDRASDYGSQVADLRTRRRVFLRPDRRRARRQASPLRLVA